jgi:hypothetical protein
LLEPFSFVLLTIEGWLGVFRYDTFTPILYPAMKVTIENLEGRLRLDGLVQMGLGKDRYHLADDNPWVGLTVIFKALPTQAPATFTKDEVKRIIQASETVVTPE